MLILGIFLDQKLAKYFWRKTHFKLAIEFAAVLSGGAGACVINF
jgi:hypothetical protein